MKKEKNQKKSKIKEKKRNEKMKALVFNIGSETIKYAFYNLEDSVKAKERKTIYIKVGNRKLAEVIKKILSKFKLSSDDIIIHRIVHGGPLHKTCFLNRKVLKKIKKYSELAPLHNPYEIKVIELCMKNSKSKQIGVFDTAFFSELPEKARIYALPEKLIKKYNIIRYGFHGINHKYISEEVSRITNKKNIKIISCHLGAGCSLAAISNGKAVDTSMGLTPLEGPFMVTRSGSIDPGIITFLEKKENLNPKQIEKILNEKSGFFGLTKTRDIEKIVKLRNLRKNKKTSNYGTNYSIAFEAFCYTIAKYIASYTIALGGLDALVFSGGIGESSKPIRKRILNYLKFLKNKLKFKTYIIKANEEQMMIKETLKLINKKQNNK